MKISVIGLGVAENASLTVQALQALQNADLVIGSARQLLTLDAILTAQKAALLPKLTQLKTLIKSAENVVVLGSGDPLYYGIGSWLTKQFTDISIAFFPALSSITQACHCLAIAQQDVKVVSLHGRPLLKLKVCLKAQQTLLILTDKHSQPQQLAALCLETGFTEAKITVCERLGYAEQKLSTFNVNELINNRITFDTLHVSFLFCGKNSGYLPEFAGIKDSYFETGELGEKGLISKREVRLAILSLLQLQKEDLLWDIGAGCGAVSVELAYWQPQATVYAIEHHQARFDCLLQNQQKFGVLSNLKPILGRAPAVLSQLPQANKIFIGGSDGELANLLSSLWGNLAEGGQIVASAVMEKSKSQLLDFYQQRLELGDCDLETLQIAINKGSSLARQLIYRPALPVSLFSFIKREKK
ncbi:bifunctional cobalt-precorrin-7 (C(5))-methyltransferase/cobalt-precorrin-6B (C(15))-methyltransferase [Psychromonas hadalis]|uniref:bifunctional cobalt-precorrin-7 (C(5))-methyltransferase/cobalt-precorrin-6B (C(15))-methyltransferase n=1 Tax=Psychromonas hadalis TaxID=211669 RepID=UPI0003B3301A|nr:bifunctional cobalt-precorrin-7 (C(5))-methyltransferase/cobalt-precorrin-6B (C(15))-methyltransferase [Psychromonas hadalis]